MVEQYIADAIKGVDNIRQQLTGYEDTTFLLRINNEHIKPVSGTMIATSQLVASDVFTLSTNNGILGTNRLGMFYDGEEIVRVENSYDLFTERLVHSDLIDSSTTATIDLTNNTLTFTDDTLEYYYSKQIFYDSTATYNVISASITVEGTNTSDATYELSTNGGSTWTELELDTITTLTSGNDLRIRISNNTGLGTGFPTAWETWGTDLYNQVILTKIQVAYTVS